MTQKELYQARRDGTGSSFVTLTYNNKSVPVSDLGYLTLRKVDAQNFMKRFRINLQRSGYNYPVKVLYCGEYGSADGRPHLHFYVIGCPTSLCDAVVRKSWDHSSRGLVSVEYPRSNCTGYICKYLSKSHPLPDVKAIYDSRHVETPFVVASQKLGFNWVNHHLDDIIDSKFTYRDVQSGERRLYPKKIRTYVEALTGVDPRPFVREYMDSIDTHGMTLDDWNSVRDYYNARRSYLDNIKHGKADYILSHCRLPPLMRGTSTPTDWKYIASIC